jgi:hypothetical protein
MAMKEGARRLGMFLGALGFVFGCAYGYDSTRNAFEQHEASTRFKSLLASDTMRNVGKAIHEDQKNWFVHNSPDPNPIVISVRVGGISQVVADRDGQVQVIRLETGKELKRTEEPETLSYFRLILYPIIGFSIPWGVVRGLTWVVSGFFEVPKG